MLSRSRSRGQPHVGIGQMMEHPCTNDLVEAGLQLTRQLDGQLADLQLVQAVCALELLRGPHARCAEVDAGHLGRRPAQGVLGGLRCSAPGDQDRSILPVGAGGPEEMMLGATSLRVLPEFAISVEVVDRARIRIPVIEVPDLIRHSRRRRIMCLSAVQCHRPASLIKRFMPILIWLPEYQRSWLKQDLIAGLSVWALMVPTSPAGGNLSLRGPSLGSVVGAAAQGCQLLHHCV